MKSNTGHRGALHFVSQLNDIFGQWMQFVHWPKYLFMSKNISQPIILFDKGNGSPTLGLIACTHGDERIGRKVLTMLRGIRPTRGRVIGILAHPRAMTKKKRFLKTD